MIPLCFGKQPTWGHIFEREFEGALALLDRSLSIDPNSPRAWNASAMIHGFMGHSDTARQHAEHAIRLSPRNPANWASYAHIAEANLQDMRYQEAADAAKKALQFNNYYLRTHLILAASCAHLGRLDEAQAAIRQALEFNSRLTIARLPELFPIARYKNLDVYLDGLRKAGLRSSRPQHVSDPKAAAASTAPRAEGSSRHTSDASTYSSNVLPSGSSK